MAPSTKKKKKKETDTRRKEVLGVSTPDYYYYLKRSGCFEVAGTDDVADYQDTLKAMNVMGLSQDQQLDVLKLVASIMHIGNIAFIENGNYAQIADPQFLAFPAYLLGVDQGMLQEKLTTRLMESRWGGKSETTTVTLTVEQVS